MNGWDVAQAFDWVGPMLQFRDVARGMRSITVLDGGGMTARELVRVLRRFGVGCGHSMFVGDDLVVMVDKPNRARWVLARYGAVAR